MYIKIKCDKCNKDAVWVYMPSSGYRCDNCVPRGCFCNIDLDDEEILDANGRKLPCCEWEYEEEGFEDTITN